jgi:catechol 2,3-dioxygenase-like lactoylglutathione lyase family enzyme
VPFLLGIHHVTLPVTDLPRSRDWYVDVFGLSVLVNEETADGLVGVTLEHPSGTLVYLRAAPRQAAALRGFALLSLSTPDRAEIDRWAGHLDACGVGHSGVRPAHLGWVLDVVDPDGLVVQLRTAEEVSGDDGG